MADETNIPPNADNTPPEECVTDEELMNLYREILDDFRKDRKDASYIADQFKEMVCNGGDASTSSKEALINAMKLQNDASDKKRRLLSDLMMQKLKSANTFQPYMIKKNDSSSRVAKVDKKAILKQVQEEKNKNVQ